MVKCVYYMSFGSNDCFMADTALTNSHYIMNIFSSVGYSKSDLVELLMLYTVTYNIRDIDFLL
jgi:hypothetical protein